MSRFALASVSPITAGRGAREALAAAAGVLGGHHGVFLVADPGLAPTGLIDEVESLLSDADLGVERFSDFSPDPKAAQAETAIGQLREAGSEIVVALGGGSALDLGKAVAGLAHADAPVEDFALGARLLPEERRPLIAVPTTSGTGAEMTRTSILSAADHSKAWYWDPRLKPDHVLLDPELTRTLPSPLTASTGIDALVHAVEAATNRNANPGNNLYALEAIRLVRTHLLRAVRDGGDMVARDGMQRAASLAGIAIDNCGTAIAHALGHALGSLRPIPHGRAVALGMMASLDWNIEEDDGRFGRVAEAMGLNGASALPDVFDALVRDIGLEVSLAETFAGVSPARLADQVRRPENIAMCRSNLREVTDGALEMLCERVLIQA